jgi:hypothetical protein
MTLIYTMLLTTVLFFIGSRAEITRGMWSRYPLAFARFMDCSMCSGAWYGLGVAVLAQLLGYHYPGLDDRHAPFVCFLASAAWTPVLAAIVTYGIEFVGVKTEHLTDEEEPQTEAPP